MKLITNKSKNLLYRIQPFVNCTVDFQTSYAVLKQTTADTYNLSFKGQLFKGVNYAGVALFSGEPISSVGKFTKTFTTPSTLPDHNTVIFGLNGATNDTTFKCVIQLKPSTTYTFTCNFTNITQGSISWKDMMLVEGSTAGEYEPYSYNLLDKWQYPATNTVNEVTFTNNGDGTIVVDGVASDTVFYRIQTVKYTYGHIYLLWWIDNNSSSMKMETNDGEKQINAYTGVIFTSKTNDSNSVYIDVYPSSNPSSVITKPVLYDLTLMYGAGKEPTTVDQFYTDYPMLKVAPLGFIGLKNIEISNKNIKRLKYKTWNNNLNMIDKSKFNPSETVNGVTFTNNGDGSWTLNGTATSHIYFPLLKVSTLQLNTSHKYLLSGCPKEGSSSLFLYVDNGGSLFDYDTGSGSIGTPTKTVAHITISIDSYTAVDNAIFKPQLYDLTNIYGAGKEPTTVDQFYKDYPLTKTSPLGFSDLGIIPSNSGYVIEEFSNLSEELLKENIEIDNVTYHIPDKTNILLNKIEGKTNKIVQLLDKTKYSATQTINGVTFTNNGDGTITYNGVTSAGANYTLQSGLKVVSGHKYLSYVGENTNDKISVLLYANEDPYDTFDNRFPNADGGISTALKNSNELYYQPKPLSNVSFSNFVLKPQFFDLTAMYGFGKEPTTVEQFKKDYPQFFDEKLDGIWNVRTSGISTTGKNLFDIDSVSFFTKVSNGEYKSNTYIGIYPDYVLWTPVDGTKQITISGYVKCPVDKNYRFAVLYEDGTGASSYMSSTGDYLYNSYTSDTSKKIKYVYLHYTGGSNEVYIKDVQIEEGSAATTYEPYQENKIDLLSTQTLNGINGVNDYIEVIDKGNGLYDLKKTQNIDSVDMGSLGFDADGNNFVTGAISSDIKPPVNDNSVGNYICQKYVNCALNKSFVDGDFGVNSSGYVYFRDSAYTTVSDFQTAVTGTMFYYQLKTPVVTTIATNLTYNQVSAIRTNGGLLLVNDNNNQKYVQPDVTLKANYQYKS